MKRTASPWRYAESTGGKWYAYGPDNAPIIIPNVKGTNRPQAEIQANLQFIAEATNLLKALSDIAEYADQCLVEHGANVPLTRIMLQARAAISKVEQEPIA